MYAGLLLQMWLRLMHHGLDQYSRKAKASCLTRLVPDFYDNWVVLLLSPWEIKTIGHKFLLGKQIFLWIMQNDNQM